MALLDELGLYLTTPSSTVPIPFGTIGTDFFLGLLPDATADVAVPDNVIAIDQLPGHAPLETFAPGYFAEQPSLLLRVRNSSYAQGSQIAYDIWTALTLISNATISGHLYYRIGAAQSPYLMERDDKRRCIFGCNLTVIRALP